MTKKKKLNIAVEHVVAGSRKLTAKWTFESIQDLESKLYGCKGAAKPLTKEEEADEIIRRLSTPYKDPREDLEEIIGREIAEEITKEIDAEIMSVMIGKNKDEDDN